jgi:cytoskeleton protein RodZ
MDASGERDLSTQTAPSLGQVLRSARTARALSIDQLATELRIEAPQLAALEQDQFEKIGPPVFVKGYLKQYGQRLGLDQQALLGMYHAQADRFEVVIQPNRGIKLRDERQIATWIIAGVVLAALVAAFAVWWIRNGRPIRLSSNEPAGVALVRDASAAPAASSELRAGGVPSEAADTAQRFAAAAAAAKPASRVAPGESAGTPAAQSDPAAAAATNDPRAAEAGVATVAAAASLAPRTAMNAATVRIALEFSADSWVEVTAADGERLLYGLAAAGRRSELAGAPPLAVVLGNAGAVSLWVDGVPQPIPRRGGNLARFSVAAPSSPAH